MRLDTRPLTAMVCDGDVMAQKASVHALRTAGFEVLGEVDNGPHLMTLVDSRHPSLVVLTNELPGSPGADFLDDLLSAKRNGTAPPVIVLISSYEDVRRGAVSQGAFAACDRKDLDALERIIDDAKHLLETGERRTKGDRRTGEDRRKVQDWSKVTRERRSGQDRRKSIRRTDDPSAPDSPDLPRRRD